MRRVSRKKIPLENDEFGVNSKTTQPHMGGDGDDGNKTKYEIDDDMHVLYV